MGMVLLESSCCMGGMVGAQALRSEKTSRVQKVLRFMETSLRVMAFNRQGTKKKLLQSKLQINSCF
jgi:hypothetical protein